VATRRCHYQRALRSTEEIADLHGGQQAGVVQCARQRGKRSLVSDREVSPSRRAALLRAVVEREGWRDMAGGAIASAGAA